MQTVKQNNTYLPTLKATKLPLMIGAGTRAELASELANPLTTSGSVWGASQQKYIMKRNKMNAKHRIGSVAKQLQMDSIVRSRTHHITALNIVVAPENAIIGVSSHGFAEWQLDDINALDKLNSLRTTVARTLANQYRNTTNGIKQYGLLSNIETTIHGNENMATSHYHLHMLLMLVDFDERQRLAITNEISTAVAGNYVNIEPVFEDYNARTGHGSELATITINSNDITDSPAIGHVIAYNAKGAGFTAYDHQLASGTTQGEALNQLPDQLRELAIVATVNTEHNRQRAQSYGFLRGRQQVTTEVMLLMTIVTQKQRHMIIQLTDQRTNRINLKYVYVDFSTRNKAPP